MKEFFSARMKPSLCTKLYKRELFHDVTFPPGRIHQDCYVNMKFALKPITYARTSEAKYYYIIRDNSITTMATGREIREAIYLFDYTMNLTKDKQLSKTAIQYLQNDAVKNH